MSNIDAKAGFTGGLLFTVYSTLDSHSIIQTMILSATGAVISFTVTMLLRKLVSKK